MPTGHDSSRLPVPRPERSLQEAGNRLAIAEIYALRGDRDGTIQALLTAVEHIHCAVHGCWPGWME